MRTTLTSMLLPITLTACAMTSGSDAMRGSAVADLADANGRPAGRALITQSADGLWIDVAATGLSAGAHGMHVHAVGKCDAPDFATAGPHWNPLGHEHGRKNPKGAHAGDAPNILADGEGKGRLKTWLGAGSLTGSEAPLLDADGAAVVIHADADDEMTDPSGKSGKRVLCGVLRPR